MAMRKTLICQGMKTVNALFPEIEPYSTGELRVPTCTLSFMKKWVRLPGGQLFFCMEVLASASFQVIGVFLIPNSVVAEIVERFCFSLYPTLTQPLQRLVWPGSSFG